MCKPIFMSNPQPSCFGLLLGWVAVAWLGFGVMTIGGTRRGTHLTTSHHQIGTSVGAFPAALLLKRRWENEVAIKIIVFFSSSLLFVLPPPQLFYDKE